jgi:hypothetical protein
MACKSWNEEWVAHLYGELDDAEERRLTEHLAGCPGCRETLEQLEASRSMLRELSPPELAVPRVVVLPSPRLRRPIWAFAAGLACASVLFAVGVMAGPLFLPPTTPAELASRPLTVDDLSRVSERQQALETRFAGLEGSLPESSMTRPQVEAALRQLQRRLELEQARNTRFLLEEIDATEFRAGRWVDETRQAIQFVALQNDPRFSER